MGTQAENRSEEIEVWEAQTRSQVRVYLSDPRVAGGYRSQKVGGPSGTKRLRIRRGDREFTQEQILDENTEQDPFTNGMLRCLSSSDEHGRIVTDERLVEYLDLSDEGQFRSMIGSVTRELTLRRLAAIAKEQGSVMQHEAVRDLLEERYRRGGTQRTVREMYQADELQGGEILSA